MTYLKVYVTVHKLKSHVMTSYFLTDYDYDYILEAIYRQETLIFKEKYMFLVMMK